MDHEFARSLGIPVFVTTPYYFLPKVEVKLVERLNKQIKQLQSYPFGIFHSGIDDKRLRDSHYFQTGGLSYVSFFFFFFLQFLVSLLFIFYIGIKSKDVFTYFI